MRWIGGGSGNIEDRRSSGGGKFALGGGVAVVAVILGLLFGKDPGQVLNSLQSGGGNEQVEASSGVPADRQGKFVSYVLEYTEDTWTDIFRDQGLEYEKPTVVLFRESTPTACGYGQSAMGPFYCPGDRKVYIDLSFYDELSERFGASGDFAQAYVIAHEVGHHVQNLLGITDKVDAMRSRLSETDYNKISVKLELQADFYAGVWAHYAKTKLNVVEDGDVDEALTAANAIGDDKIQQQSGGAVVPDAFTHGTSAQRVYWFRKGFETGDIRQGDTFNNDR